MSLGPSLGALCSQDRGQDGQSAMHTCFQAFLSQPEGDPSAQSVQGRSWTGVSWATVDALTPGDLSSKGSLVWTPCCSWEDNGRRARLLQGTDRGHHVELPDEIETRSLRGRRKRDEERATCRGRAGGKRTLLGASRDGQVRGAAVSYIDGSRFVGWGRAALGT